MIHYFKKGIKMNKKIFSKGFVILLLLTTIVSANYLIFAHSCHHHGPPDTSIWLIILYAFLAGIIGTTLGGVITILIKKPSKLFIGLALGFAASILLTITFIDLVPHALNTAHHHHNSSADLFIGLAGIVVGVLLVFSLKFFDKHGHEHIHGILPHNEECSHEDKQTANKGLIFSAILIAVAIILHDFPKGLAIGASGSVLIALTIGLAHIPEGMTIALPLKVVGVKWFKILALCVVAGFSTMLGAIIGYLVGGINPVVSQIMFGLAAGCIIGVVFSEVLPLSYQYAGKNKYYMLVILGGIVMMLVIHHFIYGLSH